MSTTEELLGRKSSGSGLENRDYGHRDPSIFYLKKLALTSPTSGGGSVGTIHSQTQATDFLVSFTRHDLTPHWASNQ
jgi:hypothetical protein